MEKQEHTYTTSSEKTKRQFSKKHTVQPRIALTSKDEELLSMNRIEQQPPKASSVE